MPEYYRIIDANLNRVAEGLRVLEDLARFNWEDQDLAASLRELRHQVRKTMSTAEAHLLNARDTTNDPGLSISRASELDRKPGLQDLITGNFKRVQEGLRVVEENLKTAGHYDKAKTYESLRYNTYTMEKQYRQKYSRRRKQDLLATDLYGITAAEHSRGRNNLEVVQAMIKAGIKIIQYREKDLKLQVQYEECRQIRDLTLQAGVTFIVNDHIDLALMVEADGVHIGQDDLPVEQVRRLVGEEMIIGLSTHSPAQAQDAIARGADYLGVGPIFQTYTKKDVCAPVGFEYLEYAVRNVPIPFVAIGGIKEHNLHDVIRRGASCVALVTEITGAADIQQKVNNLRNVIQIYSDEENGQ